MTALLEVEDLRVAYGAIEAVKGITFSVEAGQIVTLIGGNGAGKTTTLRTLSGLLKPSAGDIRFDGRSLRGIPGHAVVQRGLAHAPEGRRIFGRMTIQENLDLGAFARSDGDIRKDMQRVYDLFPVLGERRHKPAGVLSGGEQQMLTICRSLLGNPRIVLIDEPTEGLAPKIVKVVAEVIFDIRRKGVAVLLVEQKLTIAMRIAERVYVMGHGQIVFGGTPETLRNSPEVRREWLEVG